MRFRVIGRNEQTQAEVVRDIACDTPEDVEVFAVLAGILVERIEPLPDLPGPVESVGVSIHPNPLTSSDDPEPDDWPAEPGSAWDERDDCFKDAAPAERPEEFGIAPGAHLPAPLDDPLRALRRFLGWLLLLQAALVVGWLAYSLTAQPPMVKGGTLELTVRGILLGFPFTLALWRLLPNRVVNAFYLRSFRHDAATSAVRNSLLVALGPRFRLSGIRDPRRRSVKVFRYLTVFIFALRYATPKYLNLEAGADWKQRLWRSLGDARCAVIDVSDRTSFVLEEVRLCFRCLGLDRVLFVGKSTSFRDAGACKEEVARILNRPPDDPEIQAAIWDTSTAGCRAFEADVRRFADRLPPGPAGLRHDAFPLTGSPATNDAPSGEWAGVWVELGLGLALACGLAVVFRGALRVIGPVPFWAWFILVPLLGLAFCEFWQFLVYLKDCGRLRERCLALLTFGFAWSWIGVGTLGPAVEYVQASMYRLKSLENLRNIAFAMHSHEDSTNKLLLADDLGVPEPPVNADDPRIPLADRLRWAEERLRAVERLRSRPPISWRVSILPFIGDPDAMAVSREYDPREPWDGPNNIRLVERMPKIYAMPGAGRKSNLAVAGFKFVATKLNAMPGADPGEGKTAPPGYTYYRVFVSSPTEEGPRAAFTKGKPTSLGFFRAVGSDPILVVEAAESVPWTKPDELEYASKRPLAKLGGHFPGVFCAVLASGQVRVFPSDVAEADLRGWVTGNGGKWVPDR